MKKNGQTVSTTAGLHDLLGSRIRLALFFSGLFAILLIIAGFCLFYDGKLAGTYDPVALWSTVERSLSFRMQGHTIVPYVFYTNSLAGSQISHINDITELFYLVIVLLFTAAILNSLCAALAKINSKHQIQRQLGPVFDLAKTAMKLSNEEAPNKVRPAAQSAQSAGQDSQAVHFDTSSLHDMESAIASLKPDVPTSQLHTKDADLKGLESAVNSLLERSRESSAQQIRFVSDASHELRTPIAVIKGYTDMLDRWGKEDETILAESIAAIKTETEHMNRLVEQLLFLARGDSGRTQLKLESFSLSDMVREVYEESMMIDSDHRWSISADNEVTAVGDVALLKQAIRILVDNARKYTPLKETITLRAKYDDRGVATVVVQDAGIGIAAEDMSHVFDRFYRADPARVREKGGTGLGLSIAKWIIDRHEGYLEVLSREEFGTRMTIHLPMKPPAADPA